MVTPVRGLSRRSFHRLLGTGACAAACSPGTPTLALYNWGDYLAPEVLTRFTALTGALATQDYYLAEAELIAKLRSGAAYDVVFPMLAGVGDTAARAAFVIGKDGVVKYAEQTATPKDLPNFAAVKAALAK